MESDIDKPATPKPMESPAPAVPGQPPKAGPGQAPPAEPAPRSTRDTRGMPAPKKDHRGDIIENRFVDQYSGLPFHRHNK